MENNQCRMEACDPEDREYEGSVRSAGLYLVFIWRTNSGVSSRILSLLVFPMCEQNFNLFLLLLLVFLEVIYFIPQKWLLFPSHETGRETTIKNELEFVFTDHVFPLMKGIQKWLTL